jgi:hypothetical protein
MDGLIRPAGDNLPVSYFPLVPLQRLLTDVCHYQEQDELP